MWLIAWLVGLAFGVGSADVLPHLDDMVGRVFAIDGKTEAAEAEIEAWLARQPAAAPRAAVIFLLKDLRSGGKVYKQNAKWGASDDARLSRCSYMDQAVRSAGSLLSRGSLLDKRKYPVLLYHADWTDGDQMMFEAATRLNVPASSPAWWQRVKFDENTLPPYLYDVNRTVGGWREHHVDGDLSRATKANIHGFGYMLMCRFYAGLIHHGPLARKFDYYLRIDGDSRLTAVLFPVDRDVLGPHCHHQVTTDPFELMKNRGFKYGSLGGNYAETAGAAAALPAIFARRRPELDLMTKVWGADKPCGQNAFTCPFTHANAAAHKHCNLQCGLTIPDVPQETALPVQTCRGLAKGAPPCPSFYNNFEVVDMRAFRTPDQWEFFLLAERAHAFLCEAFPGRTAPGKCGGAGMGDAFFRTLQVNTFLRPTDVATLKNQVTYRHPVPIARFCGPQGTTDGGPPVQRVSPTV